MKTKRCTRCNLIKSLDEFYKTKNNQWCISCYREVNLSNYYKNPEICAERQRIRRKKNPNLCNDYRIRHPEKYKAQTALNNAVRDGRLTKLNFCEMCGCDEKIIHGHHWHGYEKEHWLDVKWLCPPCHKSQEKL